MSTTLTEQDIRTHFNTRSFLRARVLIDFRRALIGSLLGPTEVPALLDIGCGDGTISRPLIERGAAATLIDLSDEMLAAATSSLSADARSRVRALCQGFSASSNLGQFDLVLCIGVLAYAPDVVQFIGAVARHVAPGGRCVLQYTDTACVSGRLLKRYSHWRTRRQQDNVAARLTWMTKSDIHEACKQHGLSLVASKSHLPIPPGGQHLPFTVVRSLMSASAALGVGCERYLLLSKV
jgi:predicted TPR repeat methyltransferase